MKVYVIAGNLCFKEQKWFLKENVETVYRNWESFGTQPPSRFVIYKLWNKFERTALVLNAKKCVRLLIVITNDNTQVIIEAFRKILRLTSKSFNSAQSFQKFFTEAASLGFKLYRPKFVHGLFEDDPDWCLQFCGIERRKCSLNEGVKIAVSLNIYYVKLFPQIMLFTFTFIHNLLLN